MTDVTETEINAGEGEDAGRKSRKPLLLIGVAVVALLAAAGGGAHFLFASGMFADEPEEQVALIPQTYFYDLPEITVNLNTGGEAAEFLKMEIALELGDESMVSLVEPRMPRVLDAFQVYLRELRRSDLEGSAGIYRLKEELQRRVNLAVYPASVENILFKEILIQ